MHQWRSQKIFSEGARAKSGRGWGRDQLENRLQNFQKKIFLILITKIDILKFLLEIFLKFDLFSISSLVQNYVYEF